MKNDQNGFSAIELILVLVVVILIGAVGWLVYDRQKDASQSNMNPASVSSETKEQPKEATKKTEEMATYTSKYGGFTLEYPTKWQITGYENNVGTANLSGNENIVRIQNQTEENNQSNNFGMDINITTNKPEAAPFNTYPNGTTQLLLNKLTLWKEKENINYATGPTKSTCPQIYVGTDSTFSTKLKNGKYLLIYGSFCWGQGMTSTYSYNEQVNSSEWAIAENIIKSIKFN